MPNGDWPPAQTAIGLPDGTQRHGSTGQLFEAHNGQWVRVLEEATDRKLPRYQCHKKVSALKIARIQPVVGGAAIITPTHPDFAPIDVDHDYVAKHKPQAGGYYVVYDDGYKSYSPAEPFEAGYTRIQ